MTALDEYSALRRVLVGSPADLFAGGRPADEWKTLHFTAAPDAPRAIEQHAKFESLLRSSGARIDRLPANPALTLDSLYVRDASIVTPHGVVLCRMGKPARRAEPEAQARLFATLEIPVVGAIAPPGQLEGGDVVWFDQRTAAVGRGYRTNDEGIGQLRAILGTAIDLIVVPLPHFRGPADVFHLMSIISPIASDVAVVYSRLMPVPFYQWLCERGVRLVEVPDEEFESMGANVLALAPGRCVMLEGNPVTRARVEAAGVEVSMYDGSEVSVKGGGGPTCLTRPLMRGAP